MEIYNQTQSMTKWLCICNVSHSHYCKDTHHTKISHKMSAGLHTHNGYFMHGKWQLLFKGTFNLA